MNKRGNRGKRFWCIFISILVSWITIAKIPIQTHIIVLLRNNDFLSWAWGTCDYLLLPPFPINPKKASTIQISIIIWCTCTLSPEVVGSSCWSTITLYHTYDHALKSFHQSALKSIDIGDAEVLYLWQAEGRAKCHRKSSYQIEPYIIIVTRYDIALL